MSAVTYKTQRGHQVSWSWSYRLLRIARWRCWEPNWGPLEKQQSYLMGQLSSLHTVVFIHCLSWTWERLISEMPDLQT